MLFVFVLVSFLSRKSGDSPCTQTLFSLENVGAFWSYRFLLLSYSFSGWKLCMCFWCLFLLVYEMLAVLWVRWAGSSLSWRHLSGRRVLDIPIICFFLFDCLSYAPWAQLGRGALRPHSASSSSSSSVVKLTKVIAFHEQHRHKEQGEKKRQAA